MTPPTAPRGSATPWRFSRRESERYDWRYGIHIETDTDDPSPIANALCPLGSPDIGVASATLIVHAVNAHAPLVEALAKYGRHDAGCPARQTQKFADCPVCSHPDCTCGFAAALSIAREEGES